MSRFLANTDMSNTRSTGQIQPTMGSDLACEATPETVRDQPLPPRPQPQLGPPSTYRGGGEYEGARNVQQQLKPASPSASALWGSAAHYDNQAGPPSSGRSSNSRQMQKHGGVRGTRSGPLDEPATFHLLSLQGLLHLCLWPPRSRCGGSTGSRWR